jgi:hypothetical protein
MTYRRSTPYRSSTPRGEDRTGLVTSRQMAALDKMAAAHGFTSGGALLADVASSTVAELGRQPRTVVQMFVSQAFERYGRKAEPGISSRPNYGYANTSNARGRCEDAPCCGCCW